MNASKSKKIELILQQLNSLPTLPAVAARLLQITVQSDTQADEVTNLIQSDPALSAKIIALAAQSSKQVNRQIPASVGKAVMMLGFESVRNAVLSIKVFEALDSAAESDLHQFDRSAFWKHSLAVACAARRLVVLIDKNVDQEEAFMCGLLHDMGKVALDSCLPKSFARIVEVSESSLGNIAEVERKILGIDHTTAGKRLAEKWGLPTAIVETIWLHHQHPDSLPDIVENPAIVKAVHVADFLVRQQRIGYSGNHLFACSLESLLEDLKLVPEEVRQISHDLAVELSERSFVLGLETVNPVDVYQDALSDANQELGKLNSKLQLQNQKLRSRSGYFDLLCKLTRQLQPGQSVVDVCGVVSTLWQSYLKSLRCGVYAISEDGMLYEGAVLESTQQPQQFLVDCEQQIERSLKGEFQIMPANSSIDWFFSSVDADFDIAQTVNLPLFVGPQQIGGILWQSEQQRELRNELQELESFAGCCANALLQAQLFEKQNLLCEQLVQNNEMMQEMRQEMIRKKSMVTVGEMASGAAHEINNPLAVIVGRAQMLAGNEADPKRREALELIQRNGQDITEIIRELMEFAKPARPAPRDVSLHDLLSEALTLAAPLAKKEKVEVRVEMDEQLPGVFVDPQQMSRAISELLANAVAAYEQQGGIVQVQAQRDPMRNEILLEIIDQGCGIAQDQLDQIFTPFFSGKQAGRNRGMGLSRSLRQIESNGGRLDIVSAVGKGTRVRVSLPASNLTPADSVPV